MSFQRGETEAMTSICEIPVVGQRTTQSITLGQTLTLGKLKAGESSSLPPASGTVGQWVKVLVRGWVFPWVMEPPLTCAE